MIKSIPEFAVRQFSPEMNRRRTGDYFIAAIANEMTVWHFLKRWWIGWRFLAILYVYLFFFDAAQLKLNQVSIHFPEGRS